MLAKLGFVLLLLVCWLILAWSIICYQKEKKALDTQREKCYNEYVKGRSKK